MNHQETLIVKLDLLIDAVNRLRAAPLEVKLVSDVATGKFPVPPKTTGAGEKLPKTKGR
jgi:hypothetical protein